LEWWSWSWAWGGVLRCQAQLKLTLMMCMGDCSTFTSTGALSDRSTFTSISALNGRHDGSSPPFLEDLLSSRSVCVFCKSSSSLPPPIFSPLTLVQPAPNSMEKAGKWVLNKTSHTMEAEEKNNSPSLWHKCASSCS
jgi:hypothetical protein